jgi:lactoylglutathione lyase
MTKLGFVLLYTNDVPKKLAFYEKAFGAKRQYLAEQKNYGQLAGEVPIGFATVEKPPAAVEIGFVTENVDAAFDRAVSAGCAPVSKPEDKPWGQRVAYVKDDDGVLVEICTPWSV